MPEILIAERMAYRTHDLIVNIKSFIESQIELFSTSDQPVRIPGSTVHIISKLRGFLCENIYLKNLPLADMRTLSARSPLCGFSFFVSFFWGELTYLFVEDDVQVFGMRAMSLPLTAIKVW